MKTTLWKEAHHPWPALLLVLLTSATLAAGLSLPVVSLRRGISTDTYSVLAGIRDLASDGNFLLAGVVLAFSVLFPIAKLVSLPVILFRDLDPERRHELLRRLVLLGRWSMLDVFVVAILIGSIRLGILSEASAHPGIYVFGLAILLTMLSTLAVERLARTPEESSPGRPDHASLPVRTVSPLALALFLIGLAYPLMRVEKLYFWENDYSLLGGLAATARQGEVVLAVALLFFVVLLPLARLVGLVVLRWGPTGERFARGVALLEKWSMLDVFALALLIVVVKVGDLASVEPRPGMWLLLLAAVLSLLDSWELRSHRH